MPPARRITASKCTPRRLWLNQVAMFARKIRVEYELDGQRRACPWKWLDNFSMRNFTNASVFDDTLPVAAGLTEIGKKVPLDQLKVAMEDLFRRKVDLSKAAKLIWNQGTSCVSTPTVLRRLRTRMERNLAKRVCWSCYAKAEVLMPRPSCRRWSRLWNNSGQANKKMI